MINISSDLDESMQEPTGHVFQLELLRTPQMLQDGSPPLHDADSAALRCLWQGSLSFSDFESIVSKLSFSGLSGRSILNADGCVARLCG